MSTPEAASIKKQDWLCFLSSCKIEIAAKVLMKPADIPLGKPQVL